MFVGVFMAGFVLATFMVTALIVNWRPNAILQILAPTIEASLEVERIGRGPVPVLEIHNHSDADYILENLSEYTFHNFPSIFILKAHETTTLMVKTLKSKDTFELTFRVLNAYTAPDTNAEIKLTVQ